VSTEYNRVVSFGAIDDIPGGVADRYDCVDFPIVFVRYFAGSFEDRLSAFSGGFINVI
jgi:hypothetical protein